VTLLEAMASGVPAVTTAVGGNPEIVEEGVTGLLAPRGDDESLARALVEILSDRERAGAMGAAGRARVREHFTFAGMARGYADLYVELATGGRT